MQDFLIDACCSRDLVDVQGGCCIIAFAAQRSFSQAIAGTLVYAAAHAIILNDQPHISLATLPGMAERTITISGLSKTFSVTGWRLGYVIAPSEITDGVRRVHDFLTVGAPHPLQVAGAAALRLPKSYYTDLAAGYRRRGEVLLPYLRQAGFTFADPQGAYYVICDGTALGAQEDTAFAHRLIKEIGVAGVPASSFYAPREQGRGKIRFMFAKREQTLHAAGERLLKLRP